MRVLLHLLALLALASLAAPRPQDPAPDDEATGLARLLVRVVDEDDEPLFKVMVLLQPTEAEMKAAGPNGLRVENHQTDPEGELLLELPGGEARTLRISGRGGIESAVREIEAIPAGEIRELDVVLRTRDDDQVTVRVVDAETGQPIHGAALVRGQQERFFGGSDLPTALKSPTATTPRTDRDGRVTVTAATWRTRPDTVRAEGYGPTLLTVGGAPDAAGLGEGAPPLTVELKRASSVLVTLIDPPKGVRVHWGAYASSIARAAGQSLRRVSSLGRVGLTGQPVEGEAGVFLIDGLPAGVPGDLFVSNGRDVLRKLRLKSPLAPGEQQRLTLEMSARGKVEGRVVDAQGAPVVGTTVWLVLPKFLGSTSIEIYDDPLKVLETDERGAFLFEGLVAGTYLVGGPPSGGPLAAEAAAGEDKGDPLLLRAVQAKVEGPSWTSTHELTIERGLYVEGRVTGYQGDGPVDAYVRGASGGFEDSIQSVLRSNPPGTFRLGPFPPGKVNLSYMARGDAFGHCPRTQVDAGATDVELVIEQGGVIEGRVELEGDPGNTYINVRPEGSNGYSTGVRPNREFRLDNLKASVPTFVFLSRDDGRIGEPQRFVLEAGQTISDVTLELGVGATLEVTVPDQRERGFVLEAITEDGLRFYLMKKASDSRVFVATLPQGAATVKASQFSPTGKRLLGEAEVQMTRGETTAITMDLKSPPEPEPEPEDGDSGDS